MINKQQIDEQTKVLLFDTETSGFITKSLPCDHQNQGWCIQLGAILTTEESETDRLNLLIKPNGKELSIQRQRKHIKFHLNTLKRMA